MKWLAAGLHAAALSVALCVQSLTGPLAGAWLFFHLASCAVMLYSPEPPPPKNLLWKATLAWLLMVTASAFIFRPVPNGAATMWFLFAMPSLALCMKKEYLPDFLKATLAVLTVYAFGLLLQFALNVHYTLADYGGMLNHSAMAWPLLDPNNAAAVLNAGLIPCVYMALRRPRCLSAVLIFALALATTGSKAGAITAAVCCTALVIQRYRIHLPTAALAIAILIVCLLPFTGGVQRALEGSLATRIPVWSASASLLTVRPLTGIGLGMFKPYYDKVRTESVTAGFYAHNDTIQFGVEMGIPAMIVFVALALVAALSTRYGNIASGAVLAALLMQSMFEFQFYIPSVSLLAGLALAYHINQPRRVYVASHVLF